MSNKRIFIKPFLLYQIKSIFAIMKQLIECVPNFSEGRDPSVIRQITDEIEAVEGVQLLNVDPGKATNRTVVTFVGEPAAVIEAAFRAIKKAAEVIDMSRHTSAKRGTIDWRPHRVLSPVLPFSGRGRCARCCRSSSRRRRRGRRYFRRAQNPRSASPANCRGCHPS